MGSSYSAESGAGPVRLTSVTPGTVTVFGDKYVVKSNKDKGKDGAAARKTKTKTTGNTVVLKLCPHLFDWTKDSFTIVDVNDNDRELFEVGGELLSINHRRVVVDASTNEEIFCIREDWCQLDDAQTVFRAGKNGDDKQLFDVRSGYGNMNQWTKGLHTNKGKPITLEGRMGLLTMSGHLWIKTGKDGASSKAIAKIMSPLDWCDFWPRGYERDAFLVEVAEGVDYALVLAMVLAYDKMNQTYDYDDDSSRDCLFGW